ncbi:hypothetical protein K7432_013195 [Basidiobolus ranarum]|uniref:Uncharacterized protein n=1 Tax=Basidiobolus ranarum TaxID=34480 RepID=A0ABR2WJM1_9FUNG
MQISSNTNILDTARTRSSLPVYLVDSMTQESEFQSDDNQDHIHISEKEMVSKTHVIQNLHRMGHILFNNPYSTDTCLHIRDKVGATAAFWVHNFYFLHDSPALYKALSSTSNLSPSMEKLEQFHRTNKQTTTDHNGKHHIYLTVPSVEGFDELLLWIYTRNDHRWLQTMTECNFGSVMENVAFLRLSQDAYYVMAEFYENI